MKLQFNNEGFYSLQHQLYQKSDEALKIESELIRYNFNAWINNHFDLSEVQFNYLESLSQYMKLILSLETSFAIENRFPISLNIVTNTSGYKEKGLGLCRKEISPIEPVVNYTNCGAMQLNISLNIEQ